MATVAERAGIPRERAFTGHYPQKAIQQFDSQMDKLEQTSLSQLQTILKKLGINVSEKVEITELVANAILDEKFEFEITTNDNSNRIFNYGCDVVVKMADEMFI